MAITFVRNHNTGSATSATPTFTLAANVAAGNVLVVFAGFDNSGSNLPSVSSIDKPAGETAAWSLLTGARVAANATATAGAGVIGEMWAIKTTQLWPSGTTVTVTLGASVKVALLCQEFSGAVKTLRGTSGTGVSTAGQPAASTSGTALVAGDVVIGGAVCENSGSFTTDVTSFNGSWSPILNAHVGGGASAAQVEACIQNKIVTGTGVQTFNPAGLSANDAGAVIVSLIPDPNAAVTAATVNATASIGTPLLPQGPTFPVSADLAEGTGTRSFGAVTTAVNDWVVVEVIGEDGALTDVTPAATGLTFTRQTNAGTAASSVRVQQWSAPDSAGGSRTVQMTPSSGTRNYRAHLTVVRGSDGPGTGSGAAATGQTLSVTRQANHSAMFMTAGDYIITGTIGTPTWTPGGQTTSATDGTAADYAFGRWDDAGTAGTASHGIATPTLSTPSIAVLEMLLAAGASGATATPATVAATSAIPAPTVTIDVIVTPSTVAAAAAIAAPTVTTGGGGITGRTATVVDVLSGTSVTGTLPSDLVTGDWVLAVFSMFTSVANFTPPAGWTQLVAPFQSATGPITLAAYIRKDPPSGPTGSTSGTAGKQTCICQAYGGVDDTTPSDATVTTATAATSPVTIGSITTATAGARAVSAVCGNWSTGTWTQPAEMTLLKTHTAGTGKAAALADEARPTAGATGTRQWSWTAASNSIGFLAALRPAATGGGASITPATVQATASIGAPGITAGGGATATPATITCSAAIAAPTVTTINKTVLHLWAGAIATGGATVVARVTGTTNARLKVSTTSDLLTSPVFGSSVAVDANGIAKMAITGLTAGVQYYYGAELDGVLIATPQGSFKTAPSGAASFTVAFGSCHDHVGGTQDSAAWTRAKARNPDLFIQTGDFGYPDITTNSQAAFRTNYNQVLALANVAAMVRNIPAAYTWSDHDFSDNNSVGTSGNGLTAKPAAQAAYRQNVPHHPLEVSDGIYHTFVYGRVRFILTDNRSYKSLQTDVDNSSKTVLGATQKTWFKNLITSATEPLICWINEQPWIGTAGTGDDEWSNYSTERTELANHIRSSGKRVIIMSGDMHAVAADDGTNSAGNIPVLHAAPLRNLFSNKGGPYTSGPYPTSGATAIAQYGVMQITDTGSAITIRYDGYDDTDTSRVSYTETLLTGPTTVAATASIPTPTIAVSAFTAPATVAATATIPVPTVTAVRSATATPATVSGSATVPAPAVSAGGSATAIPATVTAAAAIGAPTVSAGGSATATPATVAAAAAVSAPSITIQATAAPAVVSGAASIPAPTLRLSILATPATIPATATIGVPAVSAGGGSTATPATVAATASISTPSVSAGANATVTAATLFGTVSITAPIVRISAAPTPATVAGTTSIGAPAIAAVRNATITATTIQAAGSVPTPVVQVKLVIRPNTGTTSRPGTGITIRPYAGTTVRP